MTTPKVLLKLATLALGLTVCLPGLAETPEQVQQRLERLRQLDAEAARRRQETVEFQERRKREEYARRWKRYGDEEIDVLKWRQQKDGTWITEVKNVTAQRDTASLPQIQDRAPARFDAILDAMVRDGEVSPAERDRILGIPWGAKRMSDSLVGVSCKTLMVNRKPPSKPWGSWERPGRGTTDELLVIDRCANPNRLSTP